MAEPDSSSDRAKYAACMEEIKKRIRVVDAFQNGSRNALYLKTTVESIYLQFRMILELIAMASLSASPEYMARYERFRRHYNGKRIFKDLEKVNPDFYPRPTRQVVDADSGKVVEVVDVQSGFLTKDQYVELYDICGDLLHAENPYAQGQQDMKLRLQQAAEWKNRIVTLLNHHQVQLANSGKQIWVLMHAKSDGKVHVFDFEEVGPA
ncbi:MAG: hypothetical protein F4Y02_17665 [Chloroflexi bacterium]|nr:hypothetical protein [Rhodospirillales bacterium]MYD95467.1 hypothetical protein [Chloroflexota bacterium]